MYKKRKRDISLNHNTIYSKKLIHNLHRNNTAAGAIFRLKLLDVTFPLKN
jgi:hypothetical protein